MSNCIRCYEAIIGDGTEQGDGWYCRQCAEELTDDEDAQAEPAPAPPTKASGEREEKQREFEEAVAKHVAQFNGSYMKQVREESFRAGAAWEYWDGEADTLSKKLSEAREALAKAQEYMHHMEGNMLTQTLALARSNAQRDALREALKHYADPHDIIDCAIAREALAALGDNR